MKGLLIKDFLVLKKNCWIYFLVTLLFFLMAFFDIKSMYFAYYSVAMFSVMLASASFAYDETYKWNRYEIVMPVGRKNVVDEKYMFLIITVVPLVLVESVLLYLKFGFQGSELISLMSIMLFCGFISSVMVYPIIFKFGFLKARFVNMLIIGILVSVITIINFKNSDGEFAIQANFNLQDNFLFLAVVAVLLLFISWLISRTVYSKKEF